MSFESASASSAASCVLASTLWAVWWVLFGSIHVSPQTVGLKVCASVRARSAMQATAKTCAWQPSLCRCLRFVLGVAGDVRENNLQLNSVRFKMRLNDLLLKTIWLKVRLNLPFQGVRVCSRTFCQAASRVAAEPLACPPARARHRC